MLKDGTRPNNVERLISEREFSNIRHLDTHTRRLIYASIYAQVAEDLLVHLLTTGHVEHGGLATDIFHHVAEM